MAIATEEGRDWEGGEGGRQFVSRQYWGSMHIHIFLGYCSTPEFMEAVL